MNWKKEKLGNICTVVGGGTPSTREKKYWSEDFFWVSPKDLGMLSKMTISETLRKISKDGLKNSSAKLLPVGSVILSSRAPIGYAAINTVEMATNQGCRSFICGGDIYNEYLYYFFIANTDYLNSIGSGTTFREVSGSRLKDVDIPLPPFIEQQRIVKILDEVFENIEKAKELAEKNIENFKELFRSYLNIFFSNPCIEFGYKYLNEISDNLDSKRIPVTKNMRNRGNYPYYGASGIVDYVEGYIFDEELLLISEDGANLLARTYPIAFSVNGKTWVNNHAHVLKFENKVTQKFVEFYLNSIKLDPYVSGMAQPKLNQRMLNSIKIPLPTLGEQESIVKKFQFLSLETKKLEQIYKEKLADLEELKKSVLKKAFSGEL